MYGDPTLQYIHEDPSFVLILRLKEFFSSPLIVMLQEVIGGLFKQNKEYQAIVEALGADPLEDIHAITFSIRDGDPNAACFALVGNIDGPRFAQVLPVLLSKSSSTSKLSWTGLSGAVIAGGAEAAQWSGVRIGTRADMAMAAFDPSLTLAGVMLDPASFQLKEPHTLAVLQGVEKITAELSLSNDVSFKLGLHSAMPGGLDSLWQIIQGAYQQKPKIRAELSIVAEDKKGGEALLDALFEGASIESLGSTIWLKASWSHEVMLKAFMTGLASDIISYFRKPS